MNSGTPLIPASLQAFVKNSKPVAIPIKQFYMGTGLVQKDENISRNRVFPQIIPHNTSQSIEAIAHICGLATQKVTQAGT